MGGQRRGDCHLLGQMGNVVTLGPHGPFVALHVGKVQTEFTGQILGVCAIADPRLDIPRGALLAGRGGCGGWRNAGRWP